MKKLISAVLMSAALTGVAVAANDDFTPAQTQAIGEIAANYLREHPQVLVDVSQRLQDQAQADQMKQATTAVLSNQAALLNAPGTPVYHPGGDVAVVQFFDYQCIYCAKMAPVVEQFINGNPKVRYVYKEWPIFGSRWSASTRAAQTGLSVFKSGGAEAYYRYHNAIYATGHNEGKLTGDDIRQAELEAGITSAPQEDLQGLAAILEANNQLAQRIGINGTPAFIIMPVKGATADNVTVIPGATSLSALQAAVDKARAGEAKGG
ncbi:DsbA family protein [Candidatus Pantoea multigeneris]|uniref:DsbA family protein n=1 Tax=Candidatus Pantoea multigeneris TaxID=2608357 RepID=A0ABX0RFU1_9GAMM|nr:DsbA family protein [Pantoea multigeneris]NIF23922.1 DsbA family protein [Pantoea multigeneris]